LGGWTIALYRQSEGGGGSSDTSPAVPAGYAFYAQTVTGAGGGFSFAGVLPGKYFIAEVPQFGWQRTDSPANPMTVGNNSSINGLLFGNWIPFAPFTAPDLAIKKSVNASVVSDGQEVLYTLTYTNTGNEVATDFNIVDHFDSAHMEVVDPSGGTVSGSTITWNFAGPLAINGSGSITYRMRVKSDVPAGTVINNTAVIMFDNLTDSTMQDNTDVAQIRVQSLPFLPFTGADLTLYLLVAACALALAITLRRLARVRVR
jgi:uncharacterized repeat protein (TIGR01451 family)